MTYIVARADDAIGFMIADTLLTPAFPLPGQRGPVNGQFHGLKVQILDDGRTAVGFAGNHADICLKVINLARSALLENPALDVAAKLYEEYLKANDASQLDCDFLILQISDDGKVLTHVSNTGIKSCERQWIGDKAAHERALILRKPYDPPKTAMVQLSNGKFEERTIQTNLSEIDYMQTLHAVEALVNERRVDGVGAIGGLVTVVVNARISGKLEYMQRVERGVTPWEGLVGFTLLAANDGDRRGVGLYFGSGGFGYVMPVGDSEYCHKEDAADLALFIAIAREKYQLRLTGGTW
jgi:hypothetical protein